MKYTVEYYDGDEDWRPFWAVVEWRSADSWRSGKILERCRTESEAESFAKAYDAIAAYEAGTY